MISYFANPTHFNKLARVLLPLCAILGAALWATGLYMALFASPPDYQQGETVRIMYVHVPAAWMSMFFYASLAACGVSFVVWKHLLAGFALRAIAPVGAMLTAVCLITGALWGQPMWGTWWVWDARLTSVLILFFLYLGILILDRSFADPDRGLTAASWLAMIGAVNLPIIKYSVEWWNTLHQPATLTSLNRLSNPAVDASMLKPLLLTSAGGFLLMGALVIYRLQTEMRARKLKGQNA